MPIRYISSIYEWENCMGKKGFTLLEIMIVVVIVSIIAAIAIPSYLGYVKRARRADAVTALQTILLTEEKARAETGLYKTEADLVTTFGLKPVASGNNYNPSDYYDITITVDNSDVENPLFIAYAAPKGGTQQAGDVIITIDQDGVGGRAASTSAVPTADPELWKTLRKM
jgi:type IV pilus assembly protein PilE